MPQCHVRALEAAYFEHDADIGVIGRGPTLECALVAAASATFALMVHPSQVRPLARVSVAFRESDPEYALVRWLNELLAEARAHGLALAQFRLARTQDQWRGEALGEPWRENFARGTEVKGATLTALAVTEMPDGWEARCVVDV
ncbi:MAG: archease [Betaproteobacteria bacterium]|nr:archease [Betaproteobacteria bacterium]